MADCNRQTGITDEDFAKALSGPSSFSLEGISQTNRSVSELIAADKYLRQRRRVHAGNPLAGMVSHMITPGTCDR